MRAFRQTRRILFSVMILVAAWPGSAKPGDEGFLEFTRAQRDRRYTQVPREVLAFYYTWYGLPERQGHSIHWGRIDPAKRDISESTHYPARGAYDSQDPDLMDAHIAAAQGAGLTGFIATWWGQKSYDDRAFATLLQRAAAHQFKVTAYWETAPGKDAAQADRAVDDLTYLLRCYGGNSAFLKVEGKPVIFVYGRVMDQVPMAAWPDIIRRTRAAAGDFLLVADGYRPDFARIFDGVHTYNICGWVKDKSPEALRAEAAETFGKSVELARRHARLSCLTLIPGYDDTKIRKPGLRADRQGGQTYRVLWEEALKADPDWILITSWNEWHEGSEIEPSLEDGDRDLKCTGEFAPRFTGRGPSQAPVSSSPSTLAAAKAQALQRLFGGRSIGLLPGFGGDAPFWLLDAGLNVKEVDWSGVLDPAVANAQRFPVLFYAASEHYRRTVRTERDVELALQRYLAGGGFLVVIPYEPFPFFFDDAAGKPALIARSLGLPVTGGWEQPDPGLELTFRPVAAALPGLPASAAFPATGDVRWRPAQRGLTASEDVYMTLVELVGRDGRSYGDAAAYVELGSPALRGGKVLYVWMRTPEAMGMDDALFAIFQFIGGKLGG